MKRTVGSANAGFTLIELMIVVAIIGILIAVAIPNFLKAMHRAKYNRCAQALTGLKTAQEMYISDYNVYVDDANREWLGPYMIPGCTTTVCGTEVADRIGTTAAPRNCKDFEIISLNNGYDYEIHGTATDKTECKICVTAKGIKPETYAGCPNAGPVCP